MLGPDEVLAWIKVPRPSAGEFLRAYKISKRYDDDISAVCLVVNMSIENGTVARVSMGAGGVAAAPGRAASTASSTISAPTARGTTTTRPRFSCA